MAQRCPECMHRTVEFLKAISAEMTANLFRCQTCGCLLTQPKDKPKGKFYVAAEPILRFE